MEKCSDVENRDSHKYDFELSLPEICKYSDQGNEECLRSFLNHVLVLLPPNVNSVTVHMLSGKGTIPVTVEREKSEQEQKEGEEWGFTELMEYTLKKGNTSFDNDDRES